MPSRPPAPMRAILAVLAASVLLTASAPETEAAGRVRPYKEGGSIRLDTNLLSVSGVSAWAIDEYLLANTSLPRLGSAFLAAERKYGINARFLLAAALHESNWGRSYISRTKFNLFGYNAYDRDPSRYATAFAGYARGIDGVARFMKQSYLVPSGRWWGGTPTLRSMQRFWSSSGRWGENVSRIATSIKLPSLKKRKVQFEAPVLPRIVGTDDVLSVRLAWRGGRVPDGVTFRATWTQIAAEPAAMEAASADDLPAYTSALRPDVLGGLHAASAPGLLAAAPRPMEPPVAAPVTVKAKRTKLGRSAATIRVTAPRAPGAYRLTVTLRDRDGKVLPRADKVAIPAVRVRVFGDWAVRYAVEQVADRGVRVTVTNVGDRAIPVSALPAAIGDHLGRTDVRDTRLVLHAYDSDRPAGTDLVVVPLRSPLASGASVSLEVADLAAIAPAPDIYLVPELIVHDDPLRLDNTRAGGFWFRSGRSWDLVLPTGL